MRSLLSSSSYLQCALNRLLIFTRSPIPGKAKTSLISALGAEGAALIQQQITKHTLSQLKPIVDDNQCAAEVWYTEKSRTTGELQQIEDWLGSDWVYRPQAEDDWSIKLLNAFQNAFAQGAEKVLAIGTDCPDLNVDRISKAYQQLERYDVALGKTTGGGYYLIGMKRLIPELLKGNAWATAEGTPPLETIAHNLNLKIAYLDELSNIACTEELPIWHQAKAKTMQLSVIVPVVNEGRLIQAALQDLRQAIAGQAVEILVVDGKSEDDTIAQVQSLGIPVISAPRNRATQMNLGAQLATGENLLFLHADTRLPSGFSTLVQQTLACPQTIAGAFQLRIEGRMTGLRLIEWGANWRSRLLQMPYGDQAIFMNAATFYSVGGFPQLPIMEDFEMMLRLRQQGKVCIVPTSVVTSGRRWQKLGVSKTTLINQGMIAGYLSGVAPDRLAKWYRSQR